jgi:hypothetical protein
VAGRVRFRADEGDAEDEGGQGSERHFRAACTAPGPFDP